MEDEAKARVEAELNELTEKMVKLTGFLFSKKIMEAELPDRMICLLRSQLDAMQRYAEILMRRLAIWGMTDEELDELEG